MSQNYRSTYSFKIKLINLQEQVNFSVKGNLDFVVLGIKFTLKVNNILDQRMASLV